MNKQIRKTTIALIFLFSLLLAQLTRLQIINGEKLANDPRNGRILAKNFNTARGYIQTADGVILARSVPANESKYGKRFKFQREYPEGDLYSHLVGYYSFIYGTGGLEEQYDKDLRGKNPNLGNILKPLTQSEYTGNITLTINSKLQKAARDALGNRRGSVVVLDPRDGSLLAMWSNPSFDPRPLASLDSDTARTAWNSYTADPTNPMLARSYRELFPPGSTFKTVTTAAALGLEPELAKKSYPVVRSITPPRTTQPLYNFGRGACGGSLPRILVVSCNTAFAQMGLDLGAAKLHNEAERFGFNKRANEFPLDLPRPAVSVFPETASFIRNEPALAKSAIGQQDVRATPLQMAMIAAAIGNKGVLMAPHIMKEIRDSNGEVVRTYEKKTWLSPMTPQNADALTAMMIQVVTSGTGRAARIPGIEVAGKTGTAQTLTGDTARPHAHAWFICFTPAKNPSLAVAVIVEDQEGLGDVTGGTIAAPIAKQVIQAALAQSPAPNP